MTTPLGSGRANVVALRPLSRGEPKGVVILPPMEKGSLVLPTQREGTTMTTNTQSRAQDFASRALSDLSSAQRSQLTGQSRMIAALLFAHEEEYFEGVVSGGGATVDLRIAHEQIDSRKVKRLEVTERINFILGHLFGVMEYDPGQASARKWVPQGDWTETQIAAFRQALRRVLPTVAFIIQNAGEDEQGNPLPVIQAEYQDKAMLDTGAACAIIPSGPSQGRLKVRQDLAVNTRTLKKAADAGQDLSKHPPVLLDGSSGRTIEALANVARDRLGLVQTVEAGPDAALGRLAAALAVVRNEFLECVLAPQHTREKFPQGVLQDARTATVILISALFTDPNRPQVINHDALDSEFSHLLDTRKAA